MQRKLADVMTYQLDVLRLQVWSQTASRDLGCQSTDDPNFISIWCPNGPDGDHEQFFLDLKSDLIGSIMYQSGIQNESKKKLI